MSTWNASFAAIALLVPGIRQDSAKLVDDLIARSNALKSFVATYRVHGRTTDAERREIEGDLRVVYRAPEDLRVEFKCEGLHMRSVISRGKMSVLLEEGGKPSQHGEAVEGEASLQVRARIAGVFREKFPALGDVGGSPGLGVFVRMRVQPGTEAKRPEWHVEAGTGRGDSPLLGWLGQLKTSQAPLVPEGDLLVWTAAEGVRISLRKGTGFVEKVDVTYQGETRRGLELQDLAVDGTVDDAEFATAEVDPSAVDISEAVGHGVKVTTLMAMRATILRKVREAVEAGTLEWSDETRARLGQVLRAYHTDFAPLVSQGANGALRSNVDDFCAWYQETWKNVQGRDNAGAEELDKGRIAWDEQFRKAAEKSIQSYLRAIPALEPNAPKISGEIRTLELEIAEAAMRKAVADPLVQYYAEQMERARRGELPPAKK